MPRTSRSWRSSRPRTWSRRRRLSAIAEPEERQTDLSLALLHVPRPQRFYLQALFDLDRALGDVVRTTSDPLVGQIRLAWWRERIEAMDVGVVANEPRIQALARLFEETSLRPEWIARQPDFWTPILDPFPWEGEHSGWIARRGSELFSYAAMVLKPDCDEDDLRLVSQAGAWWAGMDVARHISDADEQSTLRDVVMSDEETWRDVIVPPALRPLTMLGLLAQRDARHFPRWEDQATPGRAWAMLAHRLTGKMRI